MKKSSKVGSPIAKVLIKNSAVNLDYLDQKKFSTNSLLAMLKQEVPV